MIKFHTISSFTNVASFPNIKAHVDLNNYAAVEVDHLNGVTAFATAATDGDDLCIVMQDLFTRIGDLYFEDRKIKKNKPALCIGLKALATRFLNVGASHITGGMVAGAWTVVDDDILVPDGTGNWVVPTTAPTDGVYLVVKGFTVIPGDTLDKANEPAAIVQVVSA